MWKLPEKYLSGYPIQNSLDKVMKLRGVTFDSKFSTKEDVIVNKSETNTSSEIIKQINSEKHRKRIGVIAQELEEIVPEAVRTTHTGTKAVAYAELVSLLIEAIKEQQIQIEELRSSVFPSRLRSGSSETNATSTASATVIEGCKLFQNIPNPFSVNTDITYYVAEEVFKAVLYIYDMQGKQIKSIPINQKGHGNVTISGSELYPGMYLYTLIADGKEVDTKRMILTE